MNWLTWIFQLFSPACRSRKLWPRPPRRPLRQDFYDAASCVIEERKIAIARFRGVAANTHEDSHVFSAIEGAVSKLIDTEHPQGLILDFTELEYSWGDEMGRILSVPSGWNGEPLPMVVITSNLNRNGLTSLLLEEMFDQQPSDWLVDSEPDAHVLMASKFKRNSSYLQEREDEET